MARSDIVVGTYDDEGDIKALRLSSNVVTQTIGILARKGGGKTYLATLLAEGMLDLGAQVLAIEPVGKWWALRLDKNGRSRGKDIFVMGGQRGDVPLAPESGKLVAKALVEKRISAVLDLTFMRKGQRHRFLADLGEELLHLKQKEAAPSPLHIFCEEAQTMLPQMARHGGPAEMQMLGAWEDIVRLGRNAGIGVTLISQRPQSVNKEALSQVEALFALGVNEVPARKVIEAWVQEKGADRSIIGELPGLATGEAILWSPSWLRFFGRVKIGEKQTFDASATPKLGRLRAVGQLPKADLAALREAMASAVELAEKDDPVALRRRIAELETERSVRTIQSKLETPLRTPKRVEVPVLKDAHVKRLERLVAKLLKSQDRLAQAQQAVVSEAGNLRAALDQALERPKTVTLPGAQAMAARALHALDPKPIRPFTPVTTSMTGAGELGKQIMKGAEISAYAMGLLTTLAQRHPMTMTRSQLAILAGRSSGSSAFAGAMAALLRQECIRPANQPGRLMLTEYGQSLVGTPPAPKSGRELREHWRRALPDYEASLLQALIEVYPKELTRTELAGAAKKSLTSSAFASACSTLLKNELIEAPASGQLRVVATLMGD